MGMEGRPLAEKTMSASRNTRRVTLIDVSMNRLPVVTTALQVNDGGIQRAVDGLGPAPTREQLGSKIYGFNCFGSWRTIQPTIRKIIVEDPVTASIKFPVT